MNRPGFLLGVTATTLLAACNPSAPTRDADVDNTERTDLTVATTDGEAKALSDAIKAGDFTEFALGGRIEGPQGPQVRDAFSRDNVNYADVRSYVACPKGMDPCDPKTAPAGTIYTYVHVIIPGEDNNASAGSGRGNDSSHIERAEAFRMTRPAIGFTGSAGYAKPEALAAMGPTGDVVFTCDGGRLIWTLDSGDGGNQWGQGEPLTIYWQSTVPPAGPADAYEFIGNSVAAKGSAPYPRADKAATNACAKTAA